MSEHGTLEDGEWEDWAEVAAADLAEPTFQALVGEIDADQEAWASEYTATLAALRKALHITQTDVAERLGASQSEVSRIERREDVLVSTLRGFITALGAELELVARFRDGHVVRIDLSDVALARRRLSNPARPAVSPACALLTSTLRTGADTALRKPAVSSPAA